MIGTQRTSAVRLLRTALSVALIVSSKSYGQEQVATTTPVVPAVPASTTTPTTPAVVPVATPPVVPAVPALTETPVAPAAPIIPPMPTPPVVAPVTTEPVATPPVAPVVPVVEAPKVPVTTDVTTTGTPKPGDQKIDTTLDTVDIQEGGNWLKVRKALENTVDTIENSNVLFTKILDERMTFLKKRNKADKDFEKFLQSVGMDIGDFDRQMTQLVDRMEQDRKEEGALSEEERTLLTTVQQKKETIKELKEEIKNIAQYDSRIDDILMAFEDQINTCRDYQNQAWKNFQSIKKVYNDEKAERLYQKTEIIYTNMQAIYAYLQGDLLQYLDSTIQMFTDAMNKADSSIKDLQSKGVNLRETLEKLEHKEKTGSLPEQQKVEPVVAKKESWYAYATAVFSGVVASIHSMFNKALSTIVGMFVKKPAVVAQPVGVTTPTTSQVAPEVSTKAETPAKTE